MSSVLYILYLKCWDIFRMCAYYYIKVNYQIVCLFLVELKEHLQSFVDETNSQHGPDFIKVVRHNKQEGLIRSRVSGWRAATAPVVALFDAHVEFNTGW